jgi:hypothetical protein
MLMSPWARVIRYLICLFTLIINIYGLGVGISTIIKFTAGRGWGMTPEAGVIPLPLTEVNCLMVDVPYPKPYILIIRVNRQMKCPKS